MDNNFLVVLFKNRVKQKILNKFKTYKRVNQYFKDLEKKSNSVIFDRHYDNGVKCDYQLGLLQRSNVGKSMVYMVDSLGRNIKIEFEDPDYELVRMVNYNFEELIFDNQKKKRITIDKFMLKYLSKPGLKMISKLNHRIIVQLDESIWLFTLKTEDDGDRFINQLSDHFSSLGRMDCILVRDCSTDQRKYLYSLLEESGISKTMLYRQSTTFPSSTR